MVHDAWVIQIERKESLPRCS
ncbi:MAG: hypothetical protein ACRDFW_02820 [bacterium]